LIFSRNWLPPLSRLSQRGLTWYEGLCQRISDLSGLPLYRPAEYEATARGTAWLLAGKPRDWPEPEFGVWFKPRANPHCVHVTNAGARPWTWPSPAMSEHRPY